MESEHNVLKFLKRFRYLILALMVTASLVNAFVRFTGDWSHFWGALAVHVVHASGLRVPARGLGCHWSRWFVQRCEPLGESGISCNRVCVLPADIYL